MKENLERALKAELGSEVGATHNSDGPHALTKKKRYNILGVSPLEVEIKGKGKKLCNVFFSIRDDLGKIAHVPYSAFEEYQS
jgi:hypothetical protein